MCIYSTRYCVFHIVISLVMHLIISHAFSRISDFAIYTQQHSSITSKSYAFTASHTAQLAQTVAYLRLITITQSCMNHCSFLTQHHAYTFTLHHPKLHTKLINSYDKIRNSDEHEKRCFGSLIFHVERIETIGFKFRVQPLTSPNLTHFCLKDELLATPFW